MRSLLLLALGYPAFCFATASNHLLAQVSQQGMKFWEVCLNVQKGSGSHIKEIAEALVAAGQQCGVLVRVSPTYVVDVPGDSETLKQASKHWCLAAKDHGNPIIDRASVINVVSPNSTLPSQMCNNKIGDQRGCGEFSRPPAENVVQTLEGSANYGGTSELKQEAVSVVQGGPGAAAEAIKWGLGISEAGLVPGDSLGRGLGVAGLEGQSGAGRNTEAPLNQAACAAIRDGAFTIPNKPQPDMSHYVFGHDDDSNPMSMKTGQRAQRLSLNGSAQAGANGTSGAAEAMTDPKGQMGAPNSRRGVAGSGAGSSEPSDSTNNFQDGSGGHKKVPARPDGTSEQDASPGGGTGLGRAMGGGSRGKASSLSFIQNDTGKSSVNSATASALSGTSNSATGAGASAGGPTIRRAPGSDKSSLDPNFFSPPKKNEGAPTDRVRKKIDIYNSSSSGD